jgi:hypothetical protein
MSISDALVICNIVSTVVAVVAAPIIALWVGMKLQARANARQQKLSLLGVLLSLRHVPLSPDNFKALNLIDAVFVDDPEVREAWSKYFSDLSNQNLNDATGHAIREDKRLELMMAIITSLGLKKKISTADLLRSYAPTIVVEAENLAIWERIKRREDLRPEFIQRGIGFPDFTPVYYPPQPKPIVPGQPSQSSQVGTTPIQPAPVNKADGH